MALVFLVGSSGRKFLYSSTSFSIASSWDCSLLRRLGSVIRIWLVSCWLSTRWRYGVPILSAMCLLNITAVIHSSHSKYMQSYYHKGSVNTRQSIEQRQHQHHNCHQNINSLFNVDSISKRNIPLFNGTTYMHDHWLTPTLTYNSHFHSNSWSVFFNIKSTFALSQTNRQVCIQCV